MGCFCPKSVFFLFFDLFCILGALRIWTVFRTLSFSCFFWFGVISGMMLDPLGPPRGSFWIPGTPQNGAPIEVKRRFSRFCRFYRFATKIEKKNVARGRLFSRNGFFYPPGNSLGGPGGPKIAPFFQDPSKMGGPKNELNFVFTAVENSHGIANFPIPKVP